MRYSNLLSALLLPGLLAGCGPATEEKTGAARQRIEEAGKQLEQTAKKIEHTTRQGQGVSDTLSAIGGTLASAAAGVAKVPPADFHELKAALPDELAGLPRKKMSGETSGTYGIQTSIAKATYATAAKRPRVKVAITDPGTLTGISTLAAVWVNAQIDRQTDAGYEKTGTLNGRRFHEMFDHKTQHGEYAIIVANRFIVEVSGDGIDIARLRQAINEIDLAKLDALRVAGTR